MLEELNISEGGICMSRKNWDKIADTEFNAMDKDTQAQWAELRHRLGL
jgi:hypothetical protein